MMVRLQSLSGVESPVYIVCSRALARASPVLRLEIRHAGTTRQPHPPHGLILQLEDIDNDAMTTFLNIAHAHFLQVPGRRSIRQLYNLTRLTSRYHCTELLAPWVDSWISTVRSVVQRCDVAMMFWVFWELDMKDDLNAVARRMAGELDARELCASGRLWDNDKITGVMGTSPSFALSLYMNLIES